MLGGRQIGCEDTTEMDWNFYVRYDLVDDVGDTLLTGACPSGQPDGSLSLSRSRPADRPAR